MHATTRMLSRSTATSGSRCQYPYWNRWLEPCAMSLTTTSETTVGTTSTKLYMPSKMIACEPVANPLATPSTPSKIVSAMENLRVVCSALICFGSLSTAIAPRDERMRFDVNFHEPREDPH